MYRGSQANVYQNWFNNFNNGLGLKRLQGVIDPCSEQASGANSTASVMLLTRKRSFLPANSEHGHFGGNGSAEKTYNESGTAHHYSFKKARFECSSEQVTLQVVSVS